MTRRSRILAAVLVFAAFAQLGATRSAEQLEPFEIGAAMIQLGRVRTLAQRISKQNLLAQLKLTDVGRSAMVDTAREMDETLDILREGGIMMAVPKPPTRALREQIDEVDGAWGSIRAMALASPYDYARRSGVQRRADDPLLVRYFDDLATDLDRRAVAAVGLYKEVCIQNGVPSIVGTTAEEICTLMARATETSMLSERLAKQTSFVVGGVDQEEHLKGLQQTRERLDKTLLNALESSLIQAAMSPERGTEGNVVAGIGQSIQESWERLRVDVDRVLDGRQRELDLDQTLSTQEAFLWSVQRLSVAVERFAAQQRAKRRRASAVGAQ